MSDQFESMFARLRDQPPPVPFGAPDSVRRRARQRARRQVALASIAAVAVGGVSAGAVVTAAANQPSPSPPPVAGPYTESPTLMHVPARLLLDVEDLGPGDWQSGFTPEWAEGAYRWLWEGVCPTGDYPSLAQRIDQEEIGWTDGPFEPAAVPPWVHQVVDVFESGVGQENLADVRTAVTCAADFEVVDEGFAADESLLVRGPEHAYTAVVRTGEAVATIRVFDPQTARADQDRLREVAKRAAERMAIR